MAIYYALGTALVPAAELRANAAKASKFLDGAASGVPIDFRPIGLGKPLVVQIRHVYSGDRAHGFWRDHDMLVASAMKSVATFDAAPRAVNFLERGTKNNQDFRAVAATNKGSPLVFYSPALAQASSVVTVEVMFARFPEEAFDVVSRTFTAAGSIPVFAAASAYLLAAGIVTKLAGDVGKALVGARPALAQTEEITFVTPGSAAASAGFCLLIDDAVEDAVLKDYEVGETGQLVRRRGGKPYDGPLPYVVLSLDGRDVPAYRDFAPTAASAALLDRFYAIEEGGSQPLGPLVEGLQLYNDLEFRRRADALAAALAATNDTTSPAYKELAAEYDCCVRNIGNEHLRPPEPA